MNEIQNVIAIDGPAAAGKSTIAGRVSKRLGVPYINTGNMYRAVAWHALNNAVDKINDDAVAALLPSLNMSYDKTPKGDYALTIDGVDVESSIRAPSVAARVSEVAALPSVRRWLVEKQRKLAAIGLLVMEGRDIGTEVFPNAKHKFFLTASAEVRARRRLAQKGEIPEGATVASVAAEIAKRDDMDTRREIAPLRKAEDAALINTDDLTIDQVVEDIVQRVGEKQ